MRKHGEYHPGMKTDRFYDIFPEQFEVKTADRVDNVNTRIDPKWVGIWMMVVFYELLKKLPNQWVHLPAGSACNDIAPNELLSDVPIHYPQRQNNLCLPKSLASTLFYLELEDEAKGIDSVSGQYDQLPLRVADDLIKKHMKEHAPVVGIGQFFGKTFKNETGNRKRNTKPPMEIKDLLTNFTIYPTMVIPMGGDKSVGHAVCVVDDLIFDSTQKTVLKLYKEPLD